MSSYILLIDCADQKGLVYKVTHILYNNGLNIIRNDEFVDRETNQFFMRTEFSGQVDGQQLRNLLQSDLPSDANIRLERRHRKNIVLLVTKEHHCLGELLIRHQFGELNANVLAVVSNYEVLEELTSKFKIPYHYVSHEELPREEHEAKIMDIVERYQPDYVVLAKYMRVLTPAFVARFKNRIINIHHSFLPAFIGANPYRQAFQRGVKIIGATAHFVSNDLDEGPIIAQSVIPVDHTYSAADMAQAGRDVEKIVLAKSLKLVFEDSVFVSGNKTIIFD